MPEQTFPMKEINAVLKEQSIEISPLEYRVLALMDEFGTWEVVNALCENTLLLELVASRLNQIEARRSYTLTTSGLMSALNRCPEHETEVTIFKGYE